MDNLFMGRFYRDLILIDPDSFYSFQECNTVCKVRDILNHCGCTPSYYNNYFNATRCTLVDLSCLANWKSKRIFNPDYFLN